MKSFCTKTILAPIVFVLAIAIPSRLSAAEYLENYVQEIEVLIEESYMGRARTIALDRLDAILALKVSEKDKIEQLKAFRDRLAKKGARHPLTKLPSPKNPQVLDSDGDGIEDARDNNPLIADCRNLRWMLKSVELRIKLERDQEQIKQSFTFVEQPSDERDKAAGVHPLRLINVKPSDQKAKARLNLASSNQIPWGDKNKKLAAKCSDRVIRALGGGYSVSAIASFDVVFFNYADDQDLSIEVGDILPLSFRDKMVLRGRCVEVDKVIRLPRNTTLGKVVRFIIPHVADEDLLKLVTAMKERSPSIALESSKLKVMDKSVGELIAIARDVNRRTFAISLQTNHGVISWRVARRRNRERPSLTECLTALNKNTQSAVGITLVSFSEQGVTGVGGLANSDDVRWIVMANNGPVPDMKRALKLPMSGDMRFVLILRKLVRQDLDMYRAVLLRGVDTASYLRSRIGQRLAEWKIGHSLGWSEATFLLARCFEEGRGVPRDYKKSLELHKAAAEAGFVLAMNRLGEIYGHGQGVDMDDKVAVSWFSRAAKLGDPVAQDNLGRCYYYGLGVEQNHAKAFNLFRKAAEANYVYALSSLGTMYLDGVGTDKNEAKAIDWFKRAAELDFAPAMLRLGDLYRKGVARKPNPKQAIAWYAKAAERNDLEALNRVAEMYEHGEGVAVNLGKAGAYYRQAAEQGSARAQGNLGRLYELGLGVKQDLKTAMEWYVRAAESDDAQALTRIGRFYLTGDMVKRDYTKAMKFLRKGAEANYAPAQTQIGLIYMKGLGVEKDNKEALRWFKKAIENGDAEAYTCIGQIHETDQKYKEAVKSYSEAAKRGSVKGQTYLGRAYHFGVGVEKDPARAAECYALAVAQGDVEAKYNLGLLYETGSGIKKDARKSLELITEAANEGWARAQFYLGSIYQEGRGVEQDYGIARTLYEKAAAQGGIAAKVKLGMMFEKGEGVNKDLAKAKELYRQAAVAGDEEAKQALKRIGN